ncbi:MAG: carbamoyltransferase [Deltaproteobacteria bacterium]|nr:carbamoyltransferase [Deltaproteobacteria bacterium]
MNILGISSYYHDSAACLVRDGEVVAAVQEERFTRKKHDESFPRNAIRYCLQSQGVARGGIGAVVFYDKPIDKFVRILKTHFAMAPMSLKAFLVTMPKWVRKNLWVGLEISEVLTDLGYEVPESILFTEHHESHAASAFFPSPFREAAIVTLDGVGEWPTATIGVGEDNRITLLKEHNFPHSVGLLYTAFTYYTGFKVNSDEYKMMGLAPYGKPRYARRILDHVVSLNPDGSFRLNMRYFNYLGGLTMTNQAFHDLFEAPPRRPESPITQHTMDVARSIQGVTEEIAQRIVGYAHQITGKDRLCLAGGVALNCVANGKLLSQGPFREVWVAPAAHDAGAALGAALTVWHQLQNRPRQADGVNDTMKGCYLGPEFSPQEIETFLRGEGCDYEVLQAEDWALRIARLLANGRIVALFQGRMEFGPRALGNRSILADPRAVDAPARINKRIKFRESFRPFAPAVLEEFANEYFDLIQPSPYMLFTARIVPERRSAAEPDDPAASLQERLARERSDIPAVTHLDYSARVQTVSQKRNPKFHQILCAFHQLTGCAVLINTSLNVRGEPIVCRPQEAYRCFMKTGIDHLVLDCYLLTKPGL